MLLKNNSYLRNLVLIAVGLSGAAALIYEVISSKFFSSFLGSDIYSISTMLTAFLLGIALGSFSMSLFINRIENKRRLFAILQFLIGAYAIIFIANLNRFPLILTFFYSFSGSSLFLITLSKFLAGLLYLIFPTLLLGACFPLASSLLIQRNQEFGINVGILYSVDTFGSILGASIAGFILIPSIGLRLTTLVAAFLSFISGFLILEKKSKNILIFTLACSIFLFTFFLFPQNISPTFYLLNQHPTENLDSKEKIIYKKGIFEKDTPYGVVSVIKPEDQKSGSYLTINGRGECGSDSISERILSHLALSHFQEPINVLNLGLGCGMTLDAILEHNNVKEVDVVEINPVIVDVAKEYFSQDNHYALDDKRTHIIVDDAFHFLLMTDKKYDAVIMDVETPGVPYSSPLYTVEYFQIIAERLNNNGVFALWAYYDDYEYLRDAYYSIKKVFPYVSLVKFGEVPIFIASKKEFYVSKSIEDLRNYPFITDINLTRFDGEMMLKFENDLNYKLSTLDNPVLEIFNANNVKEYELKFKLQRESSKK